MLLRKSSRNIFVFITVVACVLGYWLVPAARRKVTERELVGCLDRPVGDVVGQLRLTDAERSWEDEPVSVLRGVSYRTADGRRVVIFLAEGEPLCRLFDEHRTWDYAAFLRCRVGGIHYEAGNVRLDIGPAVPWQWRRP